MGQILEFKPMEPPPVEIELPSRGIPYKNDGKLSIRVLTAQEEKIFATANESESALEEVLKRVIKSDWVDVNELTEGDVSAILVWLRINSYLDDYAVNLLCPHCKTEFKTFIKLSSLEEVKLKDGVEEPYEAEIAGHKVGFRFIRRKDEKELEQIKKQLLSKKGDASDIYFYRIAKAIKEIDGQEVKFSQAVDFVASLLGKDMMKVRKAMNDMSHGVNTEKEIKCKNCGATAKYNIPITAEFFLPSELPDDNGEDISIDETL